MIKAVLGLLLLALLVTCFGVFAYLVMSVGSPPDEDAPWRE